MGPIKVDHSISVQTEMTAVDSFLWADDDDSEIIMRIACLAPVEQPATMLTVKKDGPNKGKLS
ncbi:hypothetical protein OS493_003231 [Desmophyllum pertusum]|uniref:Uncharacterized protein n=1 Tax=Desmophyllum pertusum TaxID=174260 RepID=A0A9W9YH47_9CNID|nr:hypothetical protein OS493_003231 [Desmophyllum pertusum]